MTVMLEKNEGRTDRIVRAAAGAGLVAWSVRRIARSQGSVLGVLGVLTGATLLFTAATGTCPIYSALGIDTSA
jgi:uncharacterized membrane protein